MAYGPQEPAAPHNEDAESPEHEAMESPEFEAEEHRREREQAALRMMQGRSAANLAKELTTRAIANAPDTARGYRVGFTPSLDPRRWFGLHPATAAITGPPAAPSTAQPRPAAPGGFDDQELMNAIRRREELQKLR